MLVSDILRDISGRLQDLSEPKRWRWDIVDGYPSLLTYINTGLLEIVNQRPDSTAVTETITLASGYKQTIPNSAYSLIDILYAYDGDGNIAGGVTQSKRSELQSIIGKTKSGIIIDSYAYDKLDNKSVFFVCPPVLIGSTASVEMTYSAKISQVTSASDVFPLPDSFVPAMVNWVLFSVHSGDNEDMDLTRAQLHLEAFHTSLGMKTQADKVFPVKPKDGVVGGGK